jgi:hypothetical protein
MSKEQKKKCYISGKITGLPIEVATENFKKASLHARFLGLEPVNPMNIIPDGNEPKNDKWSWYMRADLKEMMDCDAILMQNNWIDSKGAILEHNLAKELGFIIMYIGKHKSVEIGNNLDYQRHDLLVDKKEDKKIWKFLSILICLIVFLYLNFNYLFPYLFK